MFGEGEREKIFKLYFSFLKNGNYLQQLLTKVLMMNAVFNPRKLLISVLEAFDKGKNNVIIYEIKSRMSSV